VRLEIIEQPSNRGGFIFEFAVPIICAINDKRI